MKNLWQKFWIKVVAVIKNILEMLLNTVEVLLTKISKVNMVQIITAATMLLQIYFERELISNAWLLIGNGILTFIFSIWKSSGTLVVSGFGNAAWTVWFSAIVTAGIGLIDLIFVNGDMVAALFGDHKNLATMIYLALITIFRTNLVGQPKQ